MNNFKSSGPGGLRNRKEFIGGRPKSDSNFGPKKSFDKKPFGGSKSGFKGGDRGGFSGDRGAERREMTMHKATCSTCKKPCEVPFRPDGSKPVLCSECFGKNRSDDRNGVERRDRSSNERPQRSSERKFDAPRGDRSPSPDIKALQQQLSILESKLNELLSIAKSSPVRKPAKLDKVTISPDEVVTVVSNIKKVPKKPVVAKKVVKKTVVKKVTRKK